MSNIGVLNYLKEKLFPASSVDDWELIMEATEKVHLRESALSTVLGRVLASASLVDFRTSDEPLYRLLNVSANDNENAKDFRSKLITKMIREQECVVLQVNDKWYIADDFIVSDYVFGSKLYSGLVVDGLQLDKTYLANELYHYKFPNAKLNKILKQLDESYVELFSRIRESQMRQSQLRIYAKFAGNRDPAKFKEEQKKYKAYLEGLSRALNKQSIVISPQNDSYAIEEKTDSYLGRSASELQVIKNMYVSEVANALQLSPLLFTGDLADVSQHEQNAIKYAIRPIFEIIVTEVNKKYFGYESDLKANVTPLTYNNVFEMSKDIEKLVGSGVYTPNEIREKLGEHQADDERLDNYYLTKNIAIIGEEEQDATRTNESAIRNTE